MVFYKAATWLTPQCQYTLPESARQEFDQLASIKDQQKTLFRYGSTRTSGWPCEHIGELVLVCCDGLDGLPPSFAASFLERLVEYLLTCTMFVRFFQLHVFQSFTSVCIVSSTITLYLSLEMMRSWSLIMLVLRASFAGKVFHTDFFASNPVPRPIVMDGFLHTHWDD